jgi:hypothetical protein
MTVKKTQAAPAAARKQKAKAAPKAQKSALTGYVVQNPIAKKTSVPRSKIRKAVLKVLSQQGA